MARNVLIMIHGMIPTREVNSPIGRYAKYWDKLCQIRDISSYIDHRINVEWGHQLPQERDIPPDNLRADHRLTPAQQFIQDRTSYDVVKKDDDPNNKVRTWLKKDITLPGVVPFKESIMLRGLGDVVYYCSKAGEEAVRKALYRQVFAGLEQFRGEEVHLHIIGHSIGVAVAHDFLFAMFNHKSWYRPGFLEYDLSAEADGSSLRERFEHWRGQAGSGGLVMGSFSSAASQLPILIQRRQELVDKLARKELLDPTHIGITAGKGVQWKLFYDVDDPLGFPTRHLYAGENHFREEIREVQVNCGGAFSAHDNYQNDDEMAKEINEMIIANAAPP